MPIRSVITGLIVVLVAIFVQPAQAAEIIVLDQEMGSGVLEELVARERCRGSSDALYQENCGGKELDDSTGPMLPNRPTLVDRIALFVYRYKDLELDEQIRPGAKLEFDADFSDAHEQNATVRLSLRIRF